MLILIVFIQNIVLFLIVISLISFVVSCIVEPIPGDFIEHYFGQLFICDKYLPQNYIDLLRKNEIYITVRFLITYLVKKLSF
jgi:hypothetical protein